ncbi:phosphomevalonate kinase [Ornithinibacillus sp. L9]|uniref:phosphomevalonate kinase n=2 Tax=Ornithinibacillus caprae TaxID=2678566 RepID=A0A6N8FNG8_9BACI|nr:phosphomevalonate kinase [Ornithinibacillus caprae]
MTVKVPGKLMIAGEFAVLEPYHKLAVMAVDRYVYASIQDNDKNLLTLENFGIEKIEWNFDGQKIAVRSDDARTEFVANAMAIALRYLKECSVVPEKFILTINSELDDDGVKYGLGSSAAVVTSVISSILERYLLTKPDADLLFKLAAITHAATQGNGSGADVAASSYGGILEYSSFQAYWLKEKYDQSETLTELLEMDWTFLSIQPLPAPKDLHICIGWTGKPASTKKLVNELLKLKEDNPLKYEVFLTKSEAAVHNYLIGMKDANLSLLLKGIKQNRQALADVGKSANVEIETPLLRKLCDIAEQYGGAGKPSGAGGGDCGIAFMPSEEKALLVKQAWEKVGIKVLDLTVSTIGATSIK